MKLARQRRGLTWVLYKFYGIPNRNSNLKTIKQTIKQQHGPPKDHQANSVFVFLFCKFPRASKILPAFASLYKQKMVHDLSSLVNGRDGLFVLKELDIFVVRRSELHAFSFRSHRHIYIYVIYCGFSFIHPHCFRGGLAKPPTIRRGFQKKTSSWHVGLSITSHIL